MRRIRSKGTNFEKEIFNEIKKSGIKFKEHYAKIIGKPDIALPRSKKAVFLHSDFWHGWQLPRWESILPSDFWKVKLRKNRKRDKKVLAVLRRQGWKAVVLWEHSFRNDRRRSIEKIIKFLRQ